MLPAAEFLFRQTLSYKPIVLSGAYLFVDEKRELPMKVPRGAVGTAIEPLGNILYFIQTIKIA